jgi:hypothetical protein
MIQRIREEKRFFGVLGGMLLALFLWNVFVRSPSAARIESLGASYQSQTSQLRSLSERGSVAGEQLDLARSSMQDAQVKLARLSDRVRYVRDPKFDVPQGQTAMNHFQNLRIKSKELVESATKKSISFNGRIQQLNFNLTPNNNEEAEEQLVRLDVVYRVFDAIFEVAGQTGMSVQRIEDVQPLQGLDGQNPITIARDRFLNKVKVGVKIRCNGMAAFRILHALCRADDKGRGSLSIEEFTAERPDATVDVLEVAIVASTLLLDLGKPLEGEP